jgi:hypothetical protein
MQDEYPPQVWFSGLPFFLQGWNTCFRRTTITSNGAPVYRLDPYVLYGAIPILGVDLRRGEAGGWAFYRHCDDGPQPLFPKADGIDHPVGEWYYSSRVTATKPIYPSHVLLGLACAAVAYWLLK